MEDQAAEHFTCFTAKYCLKTWHEQHEDGRYILFLSIFADLNRPLSPKLPDKDARSRNPNGYL